MPEYRPQNRRSLSEEQLRQQYRDSKSSKVKKKKKKKGKAPIREAPPVSPERLKRNAIRRSREQEELKRQKANKKRSRRRGSFILYYVLAGIVAVAVVSVLSVTVLFNISEFEVVGETSYSSEQVIEACGIKEGDNLLRANIGAAEENILTKLVYIDSADISRRFPNKLIITVEPAKAVASFESRGKYYLLSPKGRLLETDSEPADAPVVKGYTPPSDSVAGVQLEDDENKRIELTLKIIEVMKNCGLDASAYIDLTDTLNIIITYDDRIEMQLGASTQLEDKLEHAEMLIETEVADSEKCILMLSNPERVVKRPIYETEAPEVSEEGTDETEPEDGGEEEPSEE